MTKNSQTIETKHVILRLAIIILFVEFLVMLLLSVITVPLNLLETAILDVLLLSLFSTPIIYFWVIKPFVDERDSALNEIYHLAHSDQLTKLPNRRLLIAHFDRLATSKSDRSICHALLLLDLDGFKMVNDEYGHDAGDAVLIAVAERINSSSRVEDIACRLGGDEFAVLMQDFDQHAGTDHLLVFSDKLIKAIEEPIEFNGNLLKVSASIGIRSLQNELLWHLDSILKDADSAMYKAKDSGKGCSVISS